MAAGSTRPPRLARPKDSRRGGDRRPRPLGRHPAAAAAEAGSPNPNARFFAAGSLDACRAARRHCETQPSCRLVVGAAGNRGRRPSAALQMRRRGGDLLPITTLAGLRRPANCRWGGGAATCCRWRNCKAQAQRLGVPRHTAEKARARPVGARSCRRDRRWARRGRRDPSRAAGRRQGIPARDSKNPAAPRSRCRACRLCPPSTEHLAGMRPGRLHSLCRVPTAVRFFRAPLGRRRLCAAALDLRERPGALPVVLRRLKAAKSRPRQVRSTLYPALRYCRGGRPPAAAPLAAFLRLCACLIWPIFALWKSAA